MHNTSSSSFTTMEPLLLLLLLPLLSLQILNKSMQQKLAKCVETKLLGQLRMKWRAQLSQYSNFENDLTVFSVSLACKVWNSVNEEKKSFFYFIEFKSTMIKAKRDLENVSKFVFL